MFERDVYWEPPGRESGSDWKMTIRDRREFEAYFNSLRSKERRQLSDEIQCSHPSLHPADQAEYLKDRTKHFWIVYHKWYNDFNALDLEEDLGTLIMNDSESEQEERVRPCPPPRDGFTPADDHSGDERVPAEQASDLDEQDGDEDNAMLSPSPGPQARPHSPDLRAPFADVTPATSNTPATAKAPKRKAAKSTEAAPRKPSKASTNEGPRPPKRRRDRPRAPRSKVKIARRKFRDVDPNELPENNVHHESFLYPHFRRPPPFDWKSRAVFALNSFKIYNKRSFALASLFAIDSKDSRSNLQLEGFACALLEEEDPEFQAVESVNGHPPREEDGARRVLVASHEIIGLTLSLDGVYIETRLARYRLHSPSSSYQELTLEAQRLQALYLVGREHYILGQNRKGTERVVDTLNEVLAKTGGAPSPLEKALHSFWWTEGLLSSLEDTEIDAAIAEILYGQLPNTPYVTPSIYDIVSPLLFHGMIRTDPYHDPTPGAQRRDADEALLQGVQDEVLDFEEADEPEVEVPKKAQGSRYIDVKAVLRAGEPRTAITVYEEAIIDGKLYHAGDTVLVLGESPWQAAQDQSTSKNSRRSTADDEKEAVEEGDVDAAYEKELRRQQATKPSTLSDVAVPWFGRIVYFYYAGKDKQNLLAHIDWFHHRRATPIGKIAHARALVYADECDAIPADGIIRKIKVKRVTAEDIIPEDGFYYSNFWNKETGGYEDFEKLVDHKLADWTLLDAANAPHCFSCARRSVEVAASVEDPEPGKAEKGARVSVPAWASPKKSCDFIYEDILYHLGDLIFVTPAYTFAVKSDPHRQPFLLAHLLAIDGVDDPAISSSTPLTRVSKIRVRWLQRYNDLFSASGPTDPRRLVATDLETDVDIQNLKGKGNLLLKRETLKLATDRLASGAKATSEQLLAVGQALLSPDDFWCADELVLDDKARDHIGLTVSGEPPRKRLKSTGESLKKIAKEEASSKLPRCNTCLRQRQDRLDKEHEAEALGKKDKSQRLKALSLYSGADLFGLGLEQGCRVLDVKYAVELEKDVADACQRNKSSCTVYATPVSDFLEAAVNKTDVPTASRGEQPPPQQDNVDVILAGAPCQGFSSVNKYKKVDDIRCSEPWVYLAAMDYYRPAYSVFENVRAIQYFALPEGAEKGDLLNVLMDALMRLGYQVRADVHNAASFGTPQVRRRLILTVARKGLPLPASPKATHAYSTVLTGMAPTTYDGGARTHVVRHCHRPHGHAPHPAVTIAEAISDLPAFGFCDPLGDITNPNPSQQQWESGQPIGFSEQDERAYEQRLPQTAHQRAARINFRPGKLDLKADLSTLVLDHVVPPVSEKRASILAHIGVAGEGSKKGNYLDIPTSVDDPDDLDSDEKIALRPDFPPALRKERYHLWWKRLRWNSLLTPLRTTINPDGTSHGERIHPRDARQISVREAARMQGFPDWIQWKTYEEDNLASHIKMIGNAVPLPLAAALGRELFASVLTYLDDTDSLKPPPVASSYDDVNLSSQSPPADSSTDRKGKGKAREISPAPRPRYDDVDSGSDDDLVGVPQAPTTYEPMDDEDADVEDDSDDEEVELLLMRGMYRDRC